VTVFRYRAYDPSGNHSSGTLEASSREGAMAELDRRQLAAYSLEQQDQSDSKSSSRELSMEDQLAFARGLSSYLKSGLSLPDSLNLLKEQTGNARTSGIYSRILEGVTGGRSLFSSLRETGVFEESFCGMVETGERSGSLVVVLQKATDLFRLRLRLRRKIRSALTYPLVMAVIGSGVVAFLLAYVVPRLASLFAEVGSVLPAPTRFLLAAAVIVKVLFVPACIAGLVIFLLVRSGRLSLRIPLFRQLRDGVTLSLLFSQLGALVGAGIPLVQALEMAAPMDRNGERWKNVADDVRAGKGFASALEAQGGIRRDIVYMVRVGERGGDMEAALSGIGETCWERSELKMEQLADLIEPLTVAVLGGVTGFIVVAVLLPVFDLASLVK